MAYVLKPSLEHIALVKIVAALWNQTNIRILISNFSSSFVLSKNGKEWQKIEDRVVENILQLPLPEPLKEKASGIIKPIGFQIIKWIQKQNNRYLPVELCWTPQGTIDEKKTAELLIKDDNLDITTHYQLSCIYCLEENILKLWNKLSVEIKSLYINGDVPRHIWQKDLVFYWTAIISAKNNKLSSVIEFLSARWYYQHLFAYAAEGGNKVAMEYFFQKLTAEEKELDLIRVAKHAVMTPTYHQDHFDFCSGQKIGILCFLFSNMNEAQQVKLFESDPFELLQCFLEWPFQCFFMKIASCMWNFLPKYDFEELLSIIINKIKDGDKDCNYQNIFENFWKQSPNTHKRYILKNKCISSILENLMQIKNEANIQTILQCATLAEKKKLINTVSLEFYHDYMKSYEEWMLFSLRIEDSDLSKDEVVEFQKKFKEQHAKLLSETDFTSKKNKWDTFFYLLDDLICDNALK